MPQRFAASPAVFLARPPPPTRHTKLYRFQTLMVAAQNCAHGSTLSPPRLDQVRQAVQDHLKQNTVNTDSIFQMFLPHMKKQLTEVASFRFLWFRCLRRRMRPSRVWMRLHPCSSHSHPPPFPKLPPPSDPFSSDPSTCFGTPEHLRAAPRSLAACSIRLPPPAPV